MAKLIVDDSEINVEEGANLLGAILDNGIYVPNLCWLQEMEKSPASCRLCFVEIEGYDKPVPSCAMKARDGMIIRTDTPGVRRLQRTAFELLLSVHHIDCGNCSANRRCELQKTAKLLHIPLKQKRIESLDREVKTEDNHPFLIYDPNKCVMCGRCVYTCRRLFGSPYLEFAKRGLNMTINFFGETEADSLPCSNCYACVDICPVGALARKGG